MAFHPFNANHNPGSESTREGRGPLLRTEALWSIWESSSGVRDTGRRIYLSDSTKLRYYPRSRFSRHTRVPEAGLSN
jgi:hypothetical protein